MQTSSDNWPPFDYLTANATIENERPPRNAALDFADSIIAAIKKLPHYCLFAADIDPSILALETRIKECRTNDAVWKTTAIPDDFFKQYNTTGNKYSSYPGYEDGKEAPPWFDYVDAYHALSDLLFVLRDSSLPTQGFIRAGHGEITIEKAISTLISVYKISGKSMSGNVYEKGDSSKVYALLIENLSGSAKDRPFYQKATWDFLMNQLGKLS